MRRELVCESMLRSFFSDSLSRIEKRFPFLRQGMDDGEVFLSLRRTVYHNVFPSIGRKSFAKSIDREASHPEAVTITCKENAAIVLDSPLSSRQSIPYTLLERCRRESESHPQRECHCRRYRSEHLRSSGLFQPRRSDCCWRRRCLVHYKPSLIRENKNEYIIIQNR